MSPSVASSSRPDSGFTPRREFIREQRAMANAFSLLAISANNLIRLYSFPLTVISALRRLFQSRGILNAFREEVSQNLCEFALEGKPWGSAKSVSTERLLVDIITIVYQHGFTYLSTIDYGREQDDRLAMAFCKPTYVGIQSRSGTPLPASPVPESSISDKGSRKLPFALSFPSATLMRVVAPPLHSTPAILAAVRGSWPRGVVSEKKVGDATYEFKLKGYKWFQADTFAADSLHYILTLLSSLDAHNFSLLTSISLTSRSRVKDLWIFTGPAPTSTDDLELSESPAASVLNASNPEPRRAVPLSGTEPPLYSPHHLPQESHHKRHSTEPAVTPHPHIKPSIHAPPAGSHVRATSDGNAQYSGSPSPSFPSSLKSPNNASAMLRKPAPRAQIPVSVISTSDQDRKNEREGFRANLPSAVPSGVENMTGVGAGYTPDVFYSTSPFGRDANGLPPSLPEPVSAASAVRLQSPPPPNSTPSERPQADPVQYKRTSHSGAHSVGSSPPISGFPPTLLAEGVFRDSAFSSNSESSRDIPIKWTGPGYKDIYGRSNKSVAGKRSSSSPMPPGGWANTPEEERAEMISPAEEYDDPQELSLTQVKHPEQPIQQVGSRVASPEFTQPHNGLRQSEAGVVGMMSPPPLPPPSPPFLGKGKEREVQSVGSTQGWVLVTLEGKPAPLPAAGSPVIADEQSAARSPPPSGPSPARSPAGSTPGYSSSPKLGSRNMLKKQLSPELPQETSMSPAAKAIVLIDAVETRAKAKGREEAGGMRKFFSLSSKKAAAGS